MTNIISERIPDEMSEGWFHDVEMIYEDKNGPCYIKVVNVCPEHNLIINRIDEDFPNHVALSAFLASELSTYGARKFLYRHGVPKESLLWSLNHAGWVDMSNE